MPAKQQNLFEATQEAIDAPCYCDRDHLLIFRER